MVTDIIVKAHKAYQIKSHNLIFFILSWFVGLSPDFFLGYFFESLPTKGTLGISILLKFKIIKWWEIGRVKPHN